MAIPVWCWHLANADEVPPDSISPGGSTHSLAGFIARGETGFFCPFLVGKCSMSGFVCLKDYLSIYLFMRSELAFVWQCYLIPGSIIAIYLFYFATKQLFHRIVSVMGGDSD